MKQTKNEVEVQYETFKNTNLMYSMLCIYIKLLIKIRKMRIGRHSVGAYLFREQGDVLCWGFVF